MSSTPGILQRINSTRSYIHGSGINAGPVTVLDFGETCVYAWVVGDPAPRWSKNYSYFDVRDRHDEHSGHENDSGLAHSEIKPAVLKTQITQWNGWNKVMKVLLRDVHGVGLDSREIEEDDTQVSLDEDRFSILGTRPNQRFVILESILDLECYASLLTRTPHQGNEGNGPEFPSVVDMEKLTSPRRTDCSGSEITMGKIVNSLLHQLRRNSMIDTESSSKSIRIIPREPMRPLTYGETTCITIDISHFSTSIIPIFEGRYIPPGFGRKLIDPKVNRGMAHATYLLARSSFIVKDASAKRLIMKGTSSYQLEKQKITNILKASKPSQVHLGTRGQFASIELYAWNFQGKQYRKSNMEIWSEIRDIVLTKELIKYETLTNTKIETNLSKYELDNPNTTIVSVPSSNKVGDSRHTGAIFGGELIVIPASVCVSIADCIVDESNDLEAELYCNKPESMSTEDEASHSTTVLEEYSNKCSGLCTHYSEITYNISTCDSKSTTSFDENTLFTKVKSMTDPEVFPIDLRGRIPYLISRSDGPFVPKEIRGRIHSKIIDHHASQDAGERPTRKRSRNDSHHHASENSNKMILYPRLLDARNDLPGLWKSMGAFVIAGSAGGIVTTAPSNNVGLPHRTSIIKTPTATTVPKATSTTTAVRDTSLLDNLLAKYRKRKD